MRTRLSFARTRSSAGNVKTTWKDWYIERAFEALGDPLRLRERLAFRAMPIATRVVARLFKPALTTHLEMSAEKGGPASLNRDQGRPLLGSR